MSEREKEIISSIENAISNMSEFDKGYLLGIAETRANQKKEERSSDSREADLVQQ